MEIRPESPADVEAIRRLIEAAFRDAAHSDGTEAAIVDALRADGALTVSLVAVDEGAVVGHVAVSPVAIRGAGADGSSAGGSSAGDWFGLGPVSVLPARQGEGIGQCLIREGLARLSVLGAAGCVVLGEPAYYGRFGFESDPGLAYADVPPGYFQRLVLRGAPPKGRAHYHRTFDGP